MKKALLISLAGAMLLSGCGVSKKDYDAKIQELNTTQKELKSAKKELSSIKADLDTAKSDLEEISKKYDVCNEKYKNINEDYTELKSNYNDLDSKYKKYKDEMKPYEAQQKADAEAAAQKAAEEKRAAEEAKKAESEKKEKEKKTSLSSNRISDLKFDNSSVIDTTINDMKKNDYISDISISVDETKKQVSIVVVVPAYTDSDMAEMAGEDVARYLASLSNMANSSKYSPPESDNIGGLYDTYDLLLYVDDGLNSIDEYGAKVTSSPVITWR